MSLAEPHDSLQGGAHATEETVGSKATHAQRVSLLISPYFPPVGVSGTKRALHLTRNLPAHGWSPVVLTGRAIGEPLDETLNECVPPSTKVSQGLSGRLRPWLAQRKEAKAKGATALRAPKAPSALSQLLKRLTPRNLNYWSPFDRYLLDIPAGLKVARELIKREGVEVIHISADPWAPLIIGLKLARELKLPLIVDFRDPWSVHEGKMALRPALTRWLLRRFESRLFQVASKVILNTESARDAYREVYRGRLPAERFVAIRNAFDEGLFKAPVTPPTERQDERQGRASRFEVLYFGRFRQFVSPEQLFKGFASFVRARNVSPSEASLVLVGGLSDEHLSLARELGVAEHLEVRPPVPFREALPTLRGASCLVLVIEPDCELQIPGKLYDYFAAARPILALSANQEANEMITSLGLGDAVAHHDVDAIAEALEARYERTLSHAEGAGSAEDLSALIEPYSAREQARRVAALYEEACAEVEAGAGKATGA